MAEIKTLAATVRSGTGKGAARSVRREGKIPGVIYGGGEAAQPITLNYRDMHKLIYAGHFLTTIFEIEIDGKKERAIPRDYQLDVVRDTPLHVDFLRLKPGSRLKVNVPVHFHNQEAAPGIKRGGSLNIVLHTIELVVPADNIPESIDGRPYRPRLQRRAAHRRDQAAGRRRRGRQDQLHHRHHFAAGRRSGRGGRGRRCGRCGCCPAGARQGGSGQEVIRPVTPAAGPLA